MCRPVCPTRGVGLAALVIAGLALILDLVPALPVPPEATVLARAALAPTCHQIPERSLVLSGGPSAACARCVGLHFGGLLAGVALVVAPLGAWRRWPERRLLLAGIAPLVIDASLGMSLPSWDHPWLRVATGVLAGVSLLLAVGLPSREVGRAAAGAQ